MYKKSALLMQILLEIMIGELFFVNKVDDN